MSGLKSQLNNTNNMDYLSPKLRKVDEYVISFICDNCGERFSEIFKKGTRAVQGICTKCGCTPRRFSKSDTSDNKRYG